MNPAPCQPLRGRRIGVTRAETQLGEAQRLFAAQGASVVDLPALVVTPPDNWGPLDDALAELESFHWLVFSSANGVEAVQLRLQRRGSSLAARPRSLKIAAVGRKTAALLEELGAPADFVHPAFVADSLIEHFPVSGWGMRLLLPRVQSAAVAALERGELDAITFSSGKTVRHTAALLEAAFGKAWQQRLAEVAIVSIGPQTSARCRKLLGRVDAEADPYDLQGLVAACEQALRAQP